MGKKCIFPGSRSFLHVVGLLCLTGSGPAEAMLRANTDQTIQDDIAGLSHEADLIAAMLGGDTQAQGPEARHCADEGAPDETCHCTGIVRFGSQSSWSAWKHVSGSVQCNAEAFANGSSPFDVRSSPEGPGKCFCLPQLYQCASASSKPTPNCPGCNMSTSCICSGLTRLGNGMTWTSWRPLVGHMECSAKEFGTPMYGSEQICQCMRSQTALDAHMVKASAGDYFALVGPSMIATLAVTLCYFVVYVVLGLMRTLAQVSSSYDSARTEHVLACTTSAVYLAPMLCALYLAVSKRASSLTGGDPKAYNYPPTYLGVAGVVSAVTFCLQAFFHLRVEWLVSEQSALIGLLQQNRLLHNSPLAQQQTLAAIASSATTSSSMIRFWSRLNSFAVAIMYVGILTLLIGVGVMKQPETLKPWVRTEPVAAGTLCTVSLAVSYFAVYLVLHCLKTRDLSRTLSIGGGVVCSSYGAEVLELATTAMSFSPMLSALFMGTQIAMDWMGKGLPEDLQWYMLLATFAVLIQACLVLVTPILSDAEVEGFGQRGEVNLYARNPKVFVSIIILRWLSMSAVYFSVIVICLKLMKTTASPALTHLLAALSLIYFISYLALWVATTLRVIFGSGFLRVVKIITIAKDTVAFCPMLAVLALDSYARARRFVTDDGDTGEPQAYVQNCLYIALASLLVQLLTTVLSGALAKKPVGGSMCQITEEDKQRDWLPLLIAIFYIATAALHSSVLAVAWGMFTINAANAGGSADLGWF